MSWWNPTPGTNRVIPKCWTCEELNFGAANKRNELDNSK